MEICFCCPCCCIAFRNFMQMPREVTRRFRHTGWTACEVIECALCGKCLKVCPVRARSIENDSVRVNEGCIGCGICAVQCPQKAIAMRQIAQMKNDIKDYFEGLSLEL
ncbi:MAG: 4Fe-4S binding protein [Spirochaetes bacterium]|nr:4Fe-4S binding protein [Spirochaetota bacterium]